MKSGKIKFLFLISTLLLVLIVGTSAVSAQDEDRYSGRIWTTHGDCGEFSQDVNEYSRGDVVYINGDGFASLGIYDWTITGNPGGSSADPGIEVASGTDYQVKEDGTFCFGAYTVKDDDGGVYTVDFGDAKNDNYHVKDGPATVNIEVGACYWSPTGGSIRVVSLTINGASLTIDGVGTFYNSKNINLPAGTYTYSWTADKFFSGSGSGSFTVEECPPASASVDPQGCIDEEPYNQSNVILTISNATLTIKDSDGNVVGTYTASDTITLEAGFYTYSWIANEHYSGSGSGSFTLLTCVPGKADAGVGIGGCIWEDGKSWISVNLTINNAILEINGEEYDYSQPIKLEPGTYHYEWWAADGFEGEGDGDITLYGCEPASGSVDLGACTWNGEESLTPVTINVHGATLKLYNGDQLIGTYSGTNSYNVDLPAGSYSYEWFALDNFTGSDSGVFSTVNCEPGKADAAVEVGACVYDDGQSWTTVVITISNAKLTIAGKEYTENAEIKLTPGDYPYSWTANENYEGSGEGVVTVGTCTPKEHPDPDVAAGGLGPSFIATVAPAVLTLSGLALAWVLFKNRIKKTN